MIAPMLTANCEGRVKREYRLYESNAGAGLFLRPHSIGGLRSTEGCATIRAVTPISLHAAPARGTGFRRGRRIIPAAECPYKPDNAEHRQYEKANGDQPHEDHPDPAKG